jgi:hypothetical protein
MYERYDEVTTTVTDQLVPAPPTRAEQPDEEQYEIALYEWAQEHLFDFTGVGHFDGDSWYTVTITACTELDLVGRDFDFGF